MVTLVTSTATTAASPDAATPVTVEVHEEAVHDTWLAKATDVYGMPVAASLISVPGVSELGQKALTGAAFVDVVHPRHPEQRMPPTARAAQACSQMPVPEVIAEAAGVCES